MVLVHLTRYYKNMYLIALTCFLTHFLLTWKVLWDLKLQWYCLNENQNIQYQTKFPEFSRFSLISLRYLVVPWDFQDFKISQVCLNLKSLMNRMKRSPATNPCGTPYLTDCLAEWQPWTLVNCFQSSRNNGSHLLPVPLIQ